MEVTMMVGKHLEEEEEEEEEAHKLVRMVRYYKGLVLVMELEWWVVSNMRLDQLVEVEVEVEVAENSQGCSLAVVVVVVEEVV